MIPAPLPENEAERLEALLSYGILDTPSEAPFDDLALLAARVCEAPIAFVNFVDAERLWAKAALGMDFTECPRELSVCSHTILEGQPLVIEDLAMDPRFADNPTVAGEPGVRFYAGAPLVTASGHALGSLCAIETVPRELSSAQRDGLAALARQVVAQLELRLLRSSRSARHSPTPSRRSATAAASSRTWSGSSPPVRPNRTPSCCSTLTGSSSTTTPSATRPATPCCPVSRDSSTR